MIRHNYTVDNKNSEVFRQFAIFLQYHKVLQLDIETSVSEHWIDKKLITVQISSEGAEVGFLFQWSALTPEQKEIIRKPLESWDYEKLAHNVMFELVVLRFYGIILQNVWCTMVVEQVIYGGHELVYFSLSDLTSRYLNITLDKTLQTSFGDDILTPAKIDYAYTDVTYLGAIRNAQQAQLTAKNLNNTVWLEMRSILAFAECTYNGIYINEEKWKENEELANPVIEASFKQLYTEVVTDPRLLSKAMELNFISSSDKVVLNYNSVPSKLRALQLIFPSLTGASLGVLKKFIIDNSSTFTSEQLAVLVGLTSAKDSSYLENYLLKYHKEEMISEGFLVPKDTLIINWNSPAQVLELVKSVEPRLKSLSKDSLANVSHPIFESLKEYKDSTKLKSSFGMNFIAEHMERDGKIRTNYNPVVKTGRASSSKPNMQQVPAKEVFEEVGLEWVSKNPGKTLQDFYLRYRNAFFYLKKWKIVDSDFVGQELSLIAEVSKDEVWYKAIKNNEDLHSVTAALVFGDAWHKAALSDCKFAKEKQKCKCPEHKTMRNKIKTVNFGLALTRNTIYLQHEKYIRRIKQSRTNSKVSCC